MPNVKTNLTQNLKSLHLPTIRQCYEEVARQAEREALSYERYLHELVQRECEERQENRTAKMPYQGLQKIQHLRRFDRSRIEPEIKIQSCQSGPFCLFQLKLYSRIGVCPRGAQVRQRCGR